MRIDELKNKILQLAIQGKLVPQDENDIPASVLLEEIKKEKEQLIKEKKIKREKPLPEITEEEKPFEIPKGWEWVRLEEISYTIGNKLNQIQQKDIKKQGSYPVVSQSKNLVEGFFDDENKLLKIENPVILFGDHTTCVKYIDFDFIIGADGVKVINSIKCYPKYLYIMLLYNSSLIINRGYSRHYQFLKQKLIALPSVAEQQRIVKKVDELFAIIDELSENKEAMLKNISDTRNKVLQLAIQGKLVEQNPKDTPVSILLEEIREEKEKLIKEKKIKKEKPLPEIAEEEKPFKIPKGWEWVRLGDISFKITDGSHNPPKGEEVDSEYIMLSSQNISNNGLCNLNKVRYLSEKNYENENKRTNLKIGDLLLTIVGTIGKSCIYTEQRNIVLQRSVAVIDTKYFNKFIKVLLDSPQLQRYLNENSSGTAQKGIYLKQLKQTLIPLPSVAEQLRIVQKVDEIMAYLDELEKTILNDSII